MDVCQLVEELRQGVGKNIWICGGAEIAGRLIGKNMIDTYHLAVIRLFWEVVSGYLAALLQRLV